MKVLERWNAWRRRRQVVRRLYRLTAQVTSAREDLTRMEQLARQQQKQFVAATKQLLQELAEVNDQLSTVSAAVEDVQLQQDSQRAENDKVKEERDLLRDVTVPGLVSANELLLQRMRRITSDEIRMQTPREVSL